MSVDPQHLTFRYTFRFENGIEKSFAVVLCREDLSLVRPERNAYPEWTRLDYCKCTICPLSSKNDPYCPLATAILDVVETFGENLSFENVRVTVQAPARTYQHDTTLQRGLSSLMGILNASSGCPIMGRYRPMLETHLPFATIEETTYRVLSTYLLGQYFLHKNGRKADLELKGLLDFLAAIGQVDRDFCTRLREVVAKDANLNALVILCQYGDLTEMAITSDELDRLEKIFLAHYDGA